MFNKRLFLFDIDGTIAFDTTLIDGSMDLFNYISSIRGKYVFITNNSTKSIDDYVDKFKKMGVYVDKSNFYTSSYATALYLREHYQDKKVFVVGTQSFIMELISFGVNVTTALDDVDSIECAVVGFDNELTYSKVSDVCELLQTKQVDYIATNPDLVCPTGFGFVPDCGAICEMIGHAVNVNPKFIGKPNTVMVDLALDEFGYTKNQTLVIGDRLYTDIACGINAGVDTAVVFTGEAQKEDMEATEFKPTYQFENIRELYNYIKR